MTSHLARKLLSTPVVGIKAGDNGEEHFVHKALICHHSPYFEKAFNGSFEEAKSLRLVLHDLQEHTLRTFSAWLYTGKIEHVPTLNEDHISKVLQTSVEKEAMEASKQEREKDKTHRGYHNIDDITSEAAKMKADNPKTWYWSTLLDLYIFGDRYDVIQLRRAVLDLAIAKFEAPAASLVELATVKRAFAELPTDSPMRAFILDQYAYHSFIDTSDKHLALPTEFLCGVLQRVTCRVAKRMCSRCHTDACALVRDTRPDLATTLQTEDAAPFELDPCFYHEHKTKDEQIWCRVARQDQGSAIR